MPSAKPLLLDTHTWIWLRAGETGNFKSSSLALISEASGRSALRVSIISVWEVAMLVSKRRLQLGSPLRDWVRRALAAPGLLLSDLTPDIAVEACNLPGNPGRDPADRIIIATARLTGATLFTKDRSILKYGRLGHVAVAPI